MKPICQWQTIVRRQFCRVGVIQQTQNLSDSHCPRAGRREAEDQVLVRISLVVVAKWVALLGLEAGQVLQAESSRVACMLLNLVHNRLRHVTFKQRDSALGCNLPQIAARQDFLTATLLVERTHPRCKNRLLQRGLF